MNQGCYHNSVVRYQYSCTSFFKLYWYLLSVSEPEPDPVGSGIICRIRIRNSNFGSGSGKDSELDFCLQTEVFT